MDDLKTSTASVGAPARAADEAASRMEISRESSVKETIESILIAFILAFVFRAFVVEAFVIPTGSMATTLMGAHMRFRCPDCGYRFEVNYSAHSEVGEDLSIPTRAGPALVEEKVNNRVVRREWVDKIYNVRCPNCAYELPQNDVYGADSNVKNPLVNYGDRILVLKYLYLFQEPRRWDVVVFKSPADPAYQQNYIKRLIGRPGESIVILDGDIYVGDGEDPSQYQIQTKPRYVQQALWRNIYSNDYYPLGLKSGRRDAWRQPWTVAEGSGWKGPTGGSVSTDVQTTHQQNRVFEFDNLSSRSSIRFDPSANSAAGLNDFLVYDIEQAALPNPVGDLKLSFFYERKAGDGPLRLLMSKGEDRFVAELTPGRAKVIRQQRGGGDAVIGEAEISKTSGPLEVEFSNHDYQVALRIGNKDVIATTREQYHPEVSRLLSDFAAGKQQQAPAVELSSERQQCVLSHLNLSRDIYYINRQPGSGVVFAGTPRNIMHLGKDEYFVLGDNSLISGDARYWRDPIVLPYEDLRVGPGRVPGRFMLGKAFFVYWPAGFRPFSGAPPLAPDFGDMRFIR
jgi:signal peptidase I